MPGRVIEGLDVKAQAPSQAARLEAVKGVSDGIRAGVTDKFRRGVAPRKGLIQLNAPHCWNSRAQARVIVVWREVAGCGDDHGEDS